MNNITSGWIYSYKIDLLIFLIPSVLALFISYLIPYGLEEYISIYIILDQPHIYSTFLYTYNSKRFFIKFKRRLLWFPVLMFSFICLLMFVWGHRPVGYILAASVLYHVCKQQLAWFFIASGKENYYLNKFEKINDKAFAYLCVFGPLIISMSYIAGAKGWRTPSDLPILPDEVLYIVFSSWSVCFIIYVIYQLVKYFKFNFISWGKHFHLINGLIIWLAYRLLLFDNYERLVNFGLLLMVLGHSIPYLFLGHKYTNNRIRNNEEFYIKFPDRLPVFLILLLVGAIFAYLEVNLFNYFRNLSRVSSTLIIAFVYTVAFNHHYIDRFMWKRDTHLEGLSFLK